MLYSYHHPQIGKKRLALLPPRGSTALAECVMDREYRLSALRVQRNVLETELGEEELTESDRLERIQNRIEELEDDLAASSRT